MPCSQLAERPNANPASSRRPTANQLQAFRFDLAPAADRRKLFSKVVSAAVSAERARRVKFNQYAHSASIYICALPRERAHSGSGLSVNFLLFLPIDSFDMAQTDRHCEPQKTRVAPVRKSRNAHEHFSNTTTMQPYT